MASAVRYHVDSDEIESNNTDTSDDSVDVRVGIVKTPITPGPKRSKRKSSEPKKVVISERRDIPPPPPKKRFRLEIIPPPSVQSEPTDLSTIRPSPFRPWDTDKTSLPYFHPEPVQEEPLALIKKSDESIATPPSYRESRKKSFPSYSQKPVFADPRVSIPEKSINSAAASPPHLSSVSPSLPLSTARLASSLVPTTPVPPPPTASSSAKGKSPKQRNYKNMTPQRRVEANARERQRVHTITNAFDRLQAAIPNHEETGNKLSKLSVIKIATAYIMVLSRMAGYDYTEDRSAPSVQDCIDNCRELIEAEKKKTKDCVFYGRQKDAFSDKQSKNSWL